MEKGHVSSLLALCLIFSLLAWASLYCLAYPEPAINCGWAATAPTIDGTITSGEWIDAAVRDFTLEMRSRADGSLSKTLNATFYVQNDWTGLYAAIEIFNDDYEAQNFANNWNGLALLFDDDNDGAVDGGDNGEGVTTWTLSPFYSNNDLYWDSLASSWAPDVAAGKTNDGALVWSHTNPTQGSIGNWTFEMMIPLVGSDGDAYDFAIASLPKTVGFKIWFQEPAKGTDGIYPDDPAITQNIQEISNGATFGDLVIHPLYTLSITTTTGGTTTPVPGEHQYPYGTMAEVLAEPNSCYVFDHWELDGFDAGSGNPISVMMNQNHTLHAAFRFIYYDLTITATAGGTTNPAPGTYSHPCGSITEISAISNAGYVFDHWELDSVNVGSSNPTTVTMNKDHTLKAVFREITAVGGYSVSLSQSDLASGRAYYVVLLLMTCAVVAIARRRRR